MSNLTRNIAVSALRDTARTSPLVQVFHEPLIMLADWMHDRANRVESGLLTLSANTENPAATALWDAADEIKKTPRHPSHPNQESSLIKIETWVRDCAQRIEEEGERKSLSLSVADSLSILYRSDNAMYWPKDEQDLHRSDKFLSFQERDDAVDHLRKLKAADFIISLVSEEIGEK